MKRTVIKYVPISKKKVRVTGIENVASLDEIEEEFGEKVREEYEDDYPEYRRNVHERKRIEVLVYAKEGLVGNPDYELTVGQTLSKEAFNRVIQTMKAAGNRLGEIKKRVAEPKEIKVVIVPDPKEKSIII